MATRLRILLTLIYVANAQSHLLPLDLAGLTAGLLPGSGGEHRSILNTLDDIISAGVNTVGGIGQTLLGLRQPTGDDTNEEPHDPIVSSTANPQYIANPPNQRSGYPPYGRNKYPSPYNDKPTKAPIVHEPGKESLAGSSAEIHGDGTAPPLEGDRDASGNPIGTPVSVDGQGNIVRLPGSNGKYQPAANNVPNQNGGITKPVDLGNQQFIIVQPGTQQPNSNDVYYIPSTGSNLGNQGINIVPNYNMPTTVTDSQGRVYYVIQPNVNQPTQPPIPQNPSVKQVYVLMNINGQQALVPVNNLPVNGLQVVAPQPGNQQPSYIVIPNNPQYVIQDPYTNRPAVNPVVNYVTNAPFHSAVDPSTPSGDNKSVPKSLPDSSLSNTRDVSLDGKDEIDDKADKVMGEKDLDDAKVEPK